MSDWRDDLPPIPNERIRAEAIREGARRVEARLRRQRMVLAGGASVAAVGLIVFAASRLDLQGDDDDSDGVAGGTAAATTAAAPGSTAAPAGTSGGTTGTEAPAGTESPGTTGAPAISEPASGTTAAAATTAPSAETTLPDYTTIGGPIATLPPSAAVTVSSVVIWEEPASGPDCGAPLLTVAFHRTSPTPPVVHWETAGVRDQERMEIVEDGTARATIGPFPADTLDDGTNHEVLVSVTVGDEIFRAPTVILRDCSP